MGIFKKKEKKEKPKVEEKKSKTSTFGDPICEVNFD